MYKNILVISDNEKLCTQFNSLLIEASFKDVNWSFAISPFSDRAKFVSSINKEIWVVDLKDKTNVYLITKKFDLVFSIHCKQLFPPNLVNSVKCINIHPGYNPINRGWYPQVFSIIHNLPIGATIHEIDEHLDHGVIIDREFVEKFTSDTSESLYNRIITKEVELLRKNLKNIIYNTYVSFKPENEGNLFLKKDFNDLREICLDKPINPLDLINHLRALTHGEFKNVYFIDPVSNKKIYISIKLDEQTQ
jgi:methionyl-tRNA formyltransferase